MDSSIANLFTDLGVFEEDWMEIGDQLHKVDKPFIHQYVQNTSGSTHQCSLEVVDIFKIERPGCKVNYRFDLPNRRLLWHGTREGNVFGIIKNGFDLTKGRDGAMFGSGVYFADCVTKSANYLSRTNKIGYLFLCEVALGRMKTFTRAEGNAKNLLDGANTALGVGRYGILEENSKFSYETLICPGPLQDFGGTGLQYNEYIIYNVNQIQLRYLVKVKF